MAARSEVDLTRRERQIMDVIYEQREVSAMEVLKNLPDPPSYSAVRALLRILEAKGHVKHKRDGPRYIYMAVRSRRAVSKWALQRVVRTFFDGSVQQAVAGLLSVSDAKLSREELDSLAKLIDQAKDKSAERRS